MNSIINLTQHVASKEQRDAGVTEPADKAEVERLLTFDVPPSADEMRSRATRLAEITLAAKAEAAMIGGAPYFMVPLEAALKRAGVRVLFAFSARVSDDTVQADGSVKKVQIFKHIGFVEG